MGEFWNLRLGWWMFVMSLLLLANSVHCELTGTASAPVSAVSGTPSYVAINCGGLTPADASIPTYYGGVTYGYGKFYQPNNSYVSTGSANGPVLFQADEYYVGTSTKPRQYNGFSPFNVLDGSLYLTERYGLEFQ